ncbi:hypothetical protein [Salana multivorans]
MTITYGFAGKTAFVTGGSAGMGASTVRAFAGLTSTCSLGLGVFVLVRGLR